MDVASSHSSGTGPIVHYELPTADALEAKLVVERDSASALRDEVDMLRKQTTQSQAVLKTTIKYLVDFKDIDPDYYCKPGLLTILLVFLTHSI